MTRSDKGAILKTAADAAQNQKPFIALAIFPDIERPGISVFKINNGHFYINDRDGVEPEDWLSQLRLADKLWL